MGIARVIVDEGLMDEAFIQERTSDFEAFKKSLADYDIERVEEITGVPRAKIVEAARLYASEKPASILYSMGITQHSHGTDNVLAVGNLAMLTGNLDKNSSGVIPCEDRAMSRVPATWDRFLTYSPATRKCSGPRSGRNSAPRGECHSATSQV